MNADRTSGTAARRAATLALTVAVCAATALAAVPSPVPLRSLVAFPVLVLVAGHHGTALVLGHRARRGAGAEDDPGVDGLLRVVLPVLLGMLSLLAVVLLLGLSGIPISTASVAVGAGSAALALLLIARWGAALPGAPVWASRGAARRTAGVVVSVLVLCAAVAGAVALRPTPVERYTQLALDEPDVVAGRWLSAPSGAPVTLRWTLRGHGSALPDAEPAVGVTIGGAPASGVRVEAGRVEPGTGPGVVAERRGAVTFTAPAAAGDYRVRVTVGPDTSSLLVVGLRVAP
ncbi:hypothetical protein [Saccharothrix xinjiangensis]|uniref:Uncharacterized protein n=1 Tax=Saccharothrix xinjiangensis TaxID=204798 RepID=A0ABV9XUA7_9PSEU